MQLYIIKCLNMGSAEGQKGRSSTPSTYISREATFFSLSGMASIYSFWCWNFQVTCQESVHLCKPSYYFSTDVSETWFDFQSQLTYFWDIHTLIFYCSYVKYIQQFSADKVQAKNRVQKLIKLPHFWRRAVIWSETFQSITMLLLV